MNRSIFHISKMDCPSEERLIRMALEGREGVKSITFDLTNRDLTVVHAGVPDLVLSVLAGLNLGARLSESSAITESTESTISASMAVDDASEQSVLKKVFIINAVMFVIGFGGGVLAKSTGLIADSLDMFADATVFGLSLYAVGQTLVLKKKVAKLSGYIQLLLSIFVFEDLVRRFVLGSAPEAPVMMSLATIAFIANASCMFLLAKHRNGEVHMQASWIFLSTDVIANAGVIFAGVLVWLTKSNLPDLVIGTGIGVVVLLGSLRILKAAR